MNLFFSHYISKRIIVSKIAKFATYIANSIFFTFYFIVGFFILLSLIDFYWYYTIIIIILFIDLYLFNVIAYIFKLKSGFTI